MSMTGYTKLFASIVHSTIWRAPNHIRLVWVTMLALADRDGVVEASVPGLADAARVTLEECEEALQSLMSPDPYSRTKDHEGRRIAEVDGGWLLLNYGVYRDRMSKEHQREQARLRKQKQRNRERLKRVLAESQAVTPCHAGHNQSHESHGGHDTQTQKQKADTKAEGEACAARARDEHPPSQGPDRADDRGTTDKQTAGYFAVIKDQGVAARGVCRRCKKPNDRYAGTDRKLCSACHAEGKRPRPEHPSERTYTNDLLNSEAEQIHKLLLEHKLPLNSPTGTANHIAGRLGPLGNNKLTVARVKLAIEAVADKTAAAAADGAPRSPEEVRDHLQSFLRYSDGRWKQLEQKLKDDADEDEGYKPPADLFRPEPEPSPEERERRREAQRAGCAAILEAVKNAKRRPGPPQTPKPNSPGSDVES